MKIALIEDMTNNRKYEVRNINENNFITSLKSVSNKDIYNGFKAVDNKGNDLYITIINY